jgi:hypothetical protein
MNRVISGLLFISQEADALAHGALTQDRTLTTVVSPPHSASWSPSDFPKQAQRPPACHTQPLPWRMTQAVSLICTAVHSPRHGWGNGGPKMAGIHSAKRGSTKPSTVPRAEVWATETSHLRILWTRGRDLLHDGSSALVHDVQQHAW